MVAAMATPMCHPPGVMEGLHVNADTLADADEYVAGRIDSDELVARARARYGPAEVAGRAVDDA
jgi:Antitoxin VbhA